MTAHEESLKKVEPKEQPQKTDGNPGGSGINIDRTKILALVEQRKKKLESIKQFIPLKTYNALREKLSGEAAGLNQKIQQKQRQIQSDNQEQALPKVFFEQKFLKPKAIKIN